MLSEAAGLVCAPAPDWPRPTGGPALWPDQGIWEMGVASMGVSADSSPQKGSRKVPPCWEGAGKDSAS